jgi:hypothetical protein
MYCSMRWGIQATEHRTRRRRRPQAHSQRVWVRTVAAQPSNGPRKELGGAKERPVSTAPSLLPGIKQFPRGRGHFTAEAGGPTTGDWCRAANDATKQAGNDLVLCFKWRKNTRFLLYHLSIFPLIFYSGTSNRYSYFDLDVFTAWEFCCFQLSNDCVVMPLKEKKPYHVFVYRIVVQWSLYKSLV